MDDPRCRFSCRWLLASAALLSSTPQVARAEAGRFEVGLRYAAVSAGGTPTNDQMGPGLFGRYRLAERWLIGASIDRLTGDVERPYEELGMRSPEEIDADGESTILSAWVEREYGKHELLWFWSVGLGFTSPDVDDIAGPLEGGDSFDITTDAGSETLLSAGAGLRGSFSKRFGFELGLLGRRHLAEWTLTDRVTGEQATIGDYTTLGLQGGLRARF
jgi:hypothetical protein